MALDLRFGKLDLRVANVETKGWEGSERRDGPQSHFKVRRNVELRGNWRRGGGQRGLCSVCCSIWAAFPHTKEKNRQVGLDRNRLLKGNICLGKMEKGCHKGDMTTWSFDVNALTKHRAKYQISRWLTTGECHSIQQAFKNPLHIPME